MPISPVWSRLRWLAPSAVTAAAGGLAGGLVDALPLDGPLATAAIVGFVALAAIPLLGVLSVIVRGAIHAWRPREIVARLVDQGGAAPRFAGWVAVIWLAIAGLGWSAFQGTWLLAAWTAFKPVPIAFAEPLIAVGTLGLIVALSRPAARVFAALFRWLDRGWQRTGNGSLFSVGLVLGGTALVTIDLGYAVWLWLIKPKVGPLELGGFGAPAIGLAVMLATQLAWSLLPAARRPASAAIAVATTIAIGAALYVRLAEPGLALEIWADRPLAGRALEHEFDLDAIRTRIATETVRPLARQGARHPDLILFTIDTVRADHTPPYSGTADMPVLRDLGARGAVFEWAFAPSNEPRRAVPAIALGLAANRIRGRFDGDEPPRIDPRHVMVAERLGAGGYETAGFMCCAELWGPAAHTGLARGLQHLEIEANGPELAHRARMWLAVREGQSDRPPLFLWMHVAEPRDWVATSGEPRSDDERRKFYDRALAAADAMAAEVVAAFAHRSPDQAPIVIVTSDHGEGLGEHGQLYHGSDLYDAQLRVPLVIAGPGIAAKRIAEPVGLVDLAPTLVELAGFEPPHGAAIDGRSIADLATGRRAADVDHGQAFAVANGGVLTALVRGHWKLIDSAGNLELYDLLADPEEHANVATIHPQLAHELRDAIDHQLGDRRSPF